MGMMNNVIKEFVYKSPLRPLWTGFGKVIGDDSYKLIDERTFATKSPLSRDLIKNLQLEPLDPQDPINIAKRFKSFREKLGYDLDLWSTNKISLDDGTALIVHTNIDPSNSAKYPYRITRLTSDGVPAGHDVYKDFDEIAKTLFSDSDKIKKITQAEMRATGTPQGNIGGEGIGAFIKYLSGQRMNTESGI